MVLQVIKNSSAIDFPERRSVCLREMFTNDVVECGKKERGVMERSCDIAHSVHRGWFHYPRCFSQLSMIAEYRIFIKESINALHPV